jgi:hypothetical protein
VGVPITVRYVFRLQVEELELPGDPARDAIAASDGLEGRAGGAARFFGIK